MNRAYLPFFFRPSHQFVELAGGDRRLQDRLILENGLRQAAGAGRKMRDVRRPMRLVRTRRRSPRRGGSLTNHLRNNHLE